MAQTYAQALTTPNLVGAVRDVSDTINNLDKQETPFITAIGRKKSASSDFCEWEVEKFDVLDADYASEEAKLADPEKTSQPDFIGNHQHTVDKTASVSTKAEKVKQYNVQKKLAREIRRHTVSLKIVQNRRALGNYGSQDAKTAADGKGKFGSALALLEADKVNKGAGYVHGGYDPATKLITPYTPGTARDLTYDMFIDTMTNIAKGRKMSNYDLFANAYQRTRISQEWKGIASLTQEVGSPTKDIGLQGSLGFIKTDYGIVRIHYDHTAPEDALGIYDVSLLHMNDLEPWRTQDLGRRGLSKEKQVWNTTTFVNKNPAGHGAIVDLTVA